MSAPRSPFGDSDLTDLLSVAWFYVLGRDEDVATEELVALFAADRRIPVYLSWVEEQEFTRLRAMLDALHALKIRQRVELEQAQQEG